MAAAQGTDSTAAVTSTAATAIASTATAKPAPAAAAADVEENEAAPQPPPQPPRGETRKLFVGGVPADAAEADLLHHFSLFGEVRSVVVMRDRDTGHGRGFGFVEFVEESAAARALGEDDGDNHPRHYICGRQVEVKRARTRLPRTHDDDRPQSSRDHRRNPSHESKKLFIGGLRDSVTESEFRAYFETFGAVTDAAVIYDGLTNKSRGFGFVTFESEESVGRVMRQGFHELNGTKVEAKIAIPKDDQYYHYHRHGRGWGGQSSFGPGNYEAAGGPMYHQPYYMAQPVPAQPFYPAAPAPYFPVGGFYDGGMMPRYIPPPVYGVYPPMYPGFNVVSQDDSAAGVAAKLEHVKLGTQ